MYDEGRRGNGGSERSGRDLGLAAHGTVAQSGQIAPPRQTRRSWLTLLPMLGSRLPSDSELVGWARQRIAELLPDTWAAESLPAESGTRLPDLSFTIRAPDGTTGRLVVEAKSQSDPKQAQAAIARLKRYGASAVLVAPFLSRRTRDVLEDAAVGYADMTGNVLLRMDRPSLYVRTSGQERNPWLGGRRGRTLRGPKAGRVVRLLCDTAPQLSVGQIAEQTGTDTGYVSRVLDVLERDALIERAGRGPIQRVAWEGLIRRWAEDYKVVKANSSFSYLDPRDLSRLPVRFGKATPRYAITGSFAASFATQVAPPRLLMAYVDDPAVVAESLSLRPTTIGVNVILLRPFDAVVFDRSSQRDGITYVAMSQLAADLLTGPGRMPEEADEVLAWMRTNERRWRS